MKRCIGYLRPCDKLPWSLVLKQRIFSHRFSRGRPQALGGGCSHVMVRARLDGSLPSFDCSLAVAGGLSSLPHGPLHRQLVAAGCPRMSGLRETERDPPETGLCFHTLIWEWQPALLLDCWSHRPRLMQCVRDSTKVWGPRGRGRWGLLGEWLPQGVTRPRVSQALTAHRAALWHSCFGSLSREVRFSLYTWWEEGQLPHFFSLLCLFS